MPKPLRLQLRTEDPANLLAPFIEDYRAHLASGRYGASRQRRYMACVFHFGDWLRAEGHAAAAAADVAGRFLVDHLPHCMCVRPVQRQLIINRAALNHLLRILRGRGVIESPPADELGRELALFDARMAEVWGLSQGTRDHRCRIVRRLLKGQFGIDPIDTSRLRPSAVRAFVLGDAGWSTSTIRVMGGAVRCYLRHRQLLGDDVSGLLRAIPRPAHWREAALPETLSADELDQLLHAFDGPCPSRRRGYAMVRCLADLGLRCSEVVALRLDDIEWRAGTVSIAAGKGRRADVMPLPRQTGEALADYILHERPVTNRRELFVRHVAPIGEPIGRRVVQQAVHAAYRRLGWDRTRVHILRHTLGSRLINAGTPLKQIADVLRHRSIVTSATYARVDAVRLSAVALPWPGDLL